MTIEVGLLIAVIGCAVGVYGLVSSRDKKISKDAQWKGEVNTKLDVIVGITDNIKELQKSSQDHEKRLSILEESNKQTYSDIIKCIEKENQK